MTRKTTVLQQTLSGLRRRINGHPIVLINFRDCATNRIMDRTLRRLIGDSYKTYVHHINITPDDRSTPQVVMEKARGDLSKYLQCGAIVLGGGSWINTDDEWGEEYTEVVGSELLAAAEGEYPNVRQVHICFSSQVFAQRLGEKRLNGRLSVKPGPFECGPIGVKRLHDRDDTHPLLVDLPPNFTLVGTHGSHIVWDQRGMDDQRWRPLLKSLLTNQAVAWDGYDGMVYACVLHPEVPLIDEDGGPSHGVNQIMDELDDDYREAIKRTWGIGIEPIWDNWNQVRDRIRGDVGQELFMNALLAQARALATDMGIIQVRQG